MKEKENETRSVIKISVRNLVEFILREGDIDNRVGRGASAEAMQEGSRIHRKIQRRKGSNYHAEVPLKLVLTEEKYDLIIEGIGSDLVNCGWTFYAPSRGWSNSYSVMLICTISYMPCSMK